MRQRQSLEPFANLVSMFFTRAAERGEAPFLWAKTAAGGHWQALSWRETAARVAALAAGLERLGLARGDRVMLVSENRPEWCIADLAIMAAGCVTVPAYTTNTERDHQHVLDDSGAAAAIVSSQKLADALLPAAVRAAACRHVVAIEPVRAPQGETLQIHRWDDLVAAPAGVAACANAAAELIRDDIACLIYTSGTGGAPRGVMQHHGAILHNVEGTFAIIAEDFGIDEEEIVLSFLPLSHAYEHSAGQFLPIGLGAQIYYAEGIEKLASNIEEVRPTIMISVPRLFEVLRQRILNGLAKQGLVAQWLTRQALALGARRHAGKPRLGDRAIDLLLERSLRPKVRGRFGGRVKAMVSGGAPLNPEIGIFFDSLGIVLLQGYGQTEAGPIISANRPKAGIRMDTVGPPIANTELRIAEDGEIMVRGELVMKGYWRNSELTEATLRDGWLATGDIGHLDDAGRLVITDRKKDLIVLDKGDNVAPQRVEAMLTLQPEIAQAMVVGDRKPHLVGLIVPDTEWTSAWAKAQGKPRGQPLRDDPDYLRALSAGVDRVNRSLSVTEKVRRFILADAPFAIDNEQLTPSMKIRRHVIRQVYGERLEALYRR